MIENIRNYYGLMMVVLVALFLSFLFTGFGDHRSGSGQAFLRIEGTTYDYPEYDKLGNKTRELAMRLQMYEFIGSLGGMGAMGGDTEGGEEFFINRMLARKAAAEFGIQPSDKDVNDYIMKMSAFSNQKGEYDPAVFSNIVKNFIGRYGLTEMDVRELARDAVISQKLSEIVGSGLGVNKKIVEDTSVLGRQLVTAQIAKVSINSFKEAIKPTDEEVKAYWESIQDSFKTEPKRKFSYVIATPQLPEVKPKAEEAPKPEGAQPEKPDPTKEDPAVLEERRKKQRELDVKFDDFVSDIATKKGANFEELAKTNNFEIKTTELFNLSTPPEELTAKLRSNTDGGRAVDQLFNIKLTSDPFSKFSDPLAIGENQWLVARLDGEEPSRVKTFEEAKEQAKAQYIDEKAREAMKKSADEQLKKIREAITAGKSFADAAKDNGLESKPIGPITASYRSPDGSAPGSLFQDVSLADPGTVIDLVTEPDQAFIIFVEKREVVKMQDEAARLDSEVSRTVERNKRISYMAWLADRTEAAKVERLNRRK